MVNYFSCCRLCVKRTEGMCLYNVLEVESLSEAITKVFGFEIKSTDHCSTSICRECAENVTKFSLFKDTVLNNQNSIQQYDAMQKLQKRLSELKPIKIEGESDDEDVICVDKDNEATVSIETNGQNTQTSIPEKRSDFHRIVPAIPNGINELKELKVYGNILKKDIENLTISPRDGRIIKRKRKKITSEVNLLADKKRLVTSKENTQSLAANNTRPNTVVDLEATSNVLQKSVETAKVNSNTEIRPPQRRKTIFVENQVPRSNISPTSTKPRVECKIRKITQRRKTISVERDYLDDLGDNLRAILEPHGDQVISKTIAPAAPKINDKPNEMPVLQIMSSPKKPKISGTSTLKTVTSSNVTPPVLSPVRNINTGVQINKQNIVTLREHENNPKPRTIIKISQPAKQYIRTTLASSMANCNNTGLTKIITVARPQAITSGIPSSPSNVQGKVMVAKLSVTKPTSSNSIPPIPNVLYSTRNLNNNVTSTSASTTVVNTTVHSVAPTFATAVSSSKNINDILKAVNPDKLTESQLPATIIPTLSTNILHGPTNAMAQAQQKLKMSNTCFTLVNNTNKLQQNTQQKIISNGIPRKISDCIVTSMRPTNTACGMVKVLSVNELNSKINTSLSNTNTKSTDTQRQVGSVSSHQATNNQVKSFPFNIKLIRTNCQVQIRLSDYQNQDIPIDTLSQKDKIHVKDTLLSEKCRPQLSLAIKNSQLDVQSKTLLRKLGIAT